jgi:RNA polymerase sigma factor (sigma-70 family)
MSKFQSVKFLSAQEELEYAKLAAAGDKKAKDKLILSNLPFVAYCAKSDRGKGLSDEDLISEGTIGLIEAVNRFDYTRGFRLLTYAKFWIRRYLNLAVQNHISKNYNLLSLDAPFNSDGDESTYLSNLADTENLSVEEECENNLQTEKLWSAINGLKPAEREVVILHYGLKNQEEHSFSEIGELKGKTRSRMQQIEQKAFSHLRENLELLAG